MGEQHLTREEFKAGVEFRVGSHSSIGRKYEPEDDMESYLGIVINAGTNIYVANVEKIDEEGFTWYTSVLGHSVEHKTLFKDCIPIKNKNI